jgi:hypothetical protein
MKLFLILALFVSSAAHSQTVASDYSFTTPSLENGFSPELRPYTEKEKIKLAPQKWRVTRNHWITGALVMTAGASKGFNETLMFHWKAFRHSFPDANPDWFNPNVSWRNKYKNGDPDAGAKFPFSTSVLVMFTDQYHLNNFINKAAWTGTVVIKIGEGRKSLKHYILDLLFYTACHQIGFAATYYPFQGYRE